jgi:hypothetical protein
MIPRNRTRDSIKQSGARVPYRAQEIRTAAREEVEGEAAGWSGGGAGKGRVPAGARTGGFRVGLGSGAQVLYHMSREATFAFRPH